MNAWMHIYYYLILILTSIAPRGLTYKVHDLFTYSNVPGTDQNTTFMITLYFIFHQTLFMNNVCGHSLKEEMATINVEHKKVTQEAKFYS